MAILAVVAAVDEVAVGATAQLVAAEAAEQLVAAVATEHAVVGFVTAAAVEASVAVVAAGAAEGPRRLGCYCGRSLSVLLSNRHCKTFCWGKPHGHDGPLRGTSCT